MKTKKEIKERIKLLQNGIKIMSRSSKDVGKYLNAIIITTLMWVLEENEQECEELKEELKPNNAKVYATEIIKLKHQLDLYKQSHKTEQDRRRAFEQTLEEIREIAEPIQKNTCFGMYCGAIDEILKIINEVEDDKSND